MEDSTKADVRLRPESKPQKGFLLKVLADKNKDVKFCLS